MPIPSPIKELCIEIMTNLMKRPCSSLFLQPVNPELDGAPNYLKIVKKPTDLGTIKHHLEEGDYQSINAWWREMNLIWTNAEKFNGKESFMCYLAYEIKRNFDKEYKRVAITNMQTWVQTVSKLKDKLDDLLDEPPDPVTKYAIISEKSDVNQMKPLTEEEMDSFIKGSMLLSSPQDAKKMIHIIRSYEPRFQLPDDNAEIDVSTLSSNTLIALKNYVIQRLEDLNVPFPK